MSKQYEQVRETQDIALPPRSFLPPLEPTQLPKAYHPDSPVARGAEGAMFGGGVGLFSSSVANALQTHNKGAMGVFTRTGWMIPVFGTVGATLGFTNAAVANAIESHDNGVAGAAGGAAAGFFLGLYHRSLPAAFGLALFTGAIYGTIDLVGGFGADAGRRGALSRPEREQDRLSYLKKRDSMDAFLLFSSVCEGDDQEESLKLALLGCSAGPGCSIAALNTFYVAQTATVRVASERDDFTFRAFLLALVDPLDTALTAHDGFAACAGSAGILTGPAQKARIYSALHKVTLERKRRAELGQGAHADRSKIRLPLDEAAKVLQAWTPLQPNLSYDINVQVKPTGTIQLNAIRGRAFLPHSCANSTKHEVIVVFASGKQAEAARQAGADIVGGQELVDEILLGKISPDKLITTNELLPLFQRNPTLARTLGPRGLMPSVKRGTVTEDVAQAIQEARGGLDWKGDSKGVVRAVVGRLHFNPDQLAENVHTLLASVSDVAIGGTGSNKGGSVQRQRRPGITRVMLTSTSGPAIELADA
ncbi:Ribosomal protein [Rhodotorula toruloides ATCC 204091]|uniref:Ribosomal protein n=2 Tax=Rhodotorula toruloides TaxID=5286 RepID=A0A2T0AAZ1_RHOTO|nr:Ribosomal protein [Rhodotorula toruloides ATCC 204091]PRQ75178.1 ribosomal protein [Rhodotorula toruloides]